jgi:hypothetical protein
MIGLVDDRAAFDPETLEALSSAFDQAWDAIPNHLRHPDRLRMVLATQIFELATRGECRRDRLSQEALRRVFAGSDRLGDCKPAA